MLRKIYIVCVLCLLASCDIINSLNNSGGPPVSDSMYLEPVEFGSLDGWDSDYHAAAFEAFLHSCAEDLGLRSDTDAVGKGDLLAPATVWKQLCRKAATVPQDDEVSARRFFENEFIPMKVTGNASDNAFLTGYYVPLLNGSRAYHPPFVYPVFALPPSGTSLTRRQIDMGELRGEAPVIAFVDDPVQLFFMQIQGSGSIRLDNGQVIHVGYSGNNNHSYVSIGKVMVEKGYVDQDKVSMQAIRQWLYDHPKDMWEMMWENPSYIFFHEMNGGPYGTEKVMLTPGRSLAVDRNFIPLGMPVFIDTVVPGVADEPFSLFRRLMIAQDTGRAINGPTRGDIFFGAGYNAEQIAGRMKSGGNFTLLVPRVIASKIEQGPMGIFFHNPFPQLLDKSGDNTSGDTNGN